MIKPIIILLLLSTQFLYSQGLEDYRWENRLLLVLNPDTDQPTEHQQLKAFEGYEQEIKARDLLIFIVSGSQVLDSAGNPVDLQVDQIPYHAYSGLMLIGKDGGVKLKKPFVVSPGEIFELIDSMPMRRAEMKKSKQN